MLSARNSETCENKNIVDHESNGNVIEPYSFIYISTSGASSSVTYRLNDTCSRSSYIQFDFGVGIMVHNIAMFWDFCLCYYLQIPF